MCFVLELDFREKEIAGVLSSVVEAASHLTDHDPSKILQLQGWCGKIWLNKYNLL